MEKSSWEPNTYSIEMKDIQIKLHQDSDSQSLLRGPLVVRKTSWSGPQLPIPVFFNLFQVAEPLKHYWTYGGT